MPLVAVNYWSLSTGVYFTIISLHIVLLLTEKGLKATRKKIRKMIKSKLIV